MTTNVTDTDWWITTVIRRATLGEYVVIGPAQRVFRTEPHGTVVTAVPHHEHDTVTDLLADHRLIIGDRCHTTYSGDTGPAHTLTVPTGACRTCGGSDRVSINRQAIWTPERGVHRPTGTTPCPACHPPPTTRRRR